MYLFVSFQGIEQEINLERSFVSGLLYQGRDYVQRDPDNPILPSDLARLEDDWNQLGHALFSLATWPQFGLILTKEQYSPRRLYFPDWNNNNIHNRKKNHNSQLSPRQTASSSTQTPHQAQKPHHAQIFQECTCRCSRDQPVSNLKLKRFRSSNNLQQLDLEINSCESDLGSSTSTLRACASLSSSCESFHTACLDSDFDDDFAVADKETKWYSREEEPYHSPDHNCSKEKPPGLNSLEPSRAKMNLAEANCDHDSGRSSPSVAGAACLATPPRRRPERLSLSPPILLGGRPLGGAPDESPALPKRRKMFHHDDTPSSMSSPCDSPVNMSAFSDLLSVSMDELSGQSFDDSTVSSPTASPATFRREFRRKCKKDDLWRAIADDYKYLMDDGIVETCKVSILTSVSTCEYTTCTRISLILLQLVHTSKYFKSVFSSVQHGFSICSENSALNLKVK